MKVVSFNTEEEAEAFNKEKAASMNCQETTTLWWPMFEHEGQFVVVVNDELDVDGKSPPNVTTIKITEDTNGIYS